MNQPNSSNWPSFTEEEAEAIKRVLLSNKVNYWTGQECRKFEHEFGGWCGTKHAIALTNGTVALDLALAGLKIGTRNGGQITDQVIVTPRSFIASASTVVTAGAVPIFADVDSDSGNIKVDTIAAVLSPNTKAIVTVHLAGWPCDMDPIMEFAKLHSLKVIEDCAQAHGARYKGRSVGSIGHVGAWSFCQDKIMTTGGEGGMVTTNDPDLWSKMWSLKDHGKNWEAVFERDHLPGFRWVHDNFGTNWRMTEIQAVIGRIQLKRMQNWSRKRNENAAHISKILSKFSGTNGIVRTPQIKSPSTPASESENTSVHAFYKYSCYIQPENLAPGWTRDRIIQEVTALGVPCFQGSCSEIYLEKAFDQTGWRPKERLPVAQELGETSLTLLVHPTLTDDEMARTGKVLTKVLTHASIT